MVKNDHAAHDVKDVELQKGKQIYPIQKGRKNTNKKI